MRAISAAEKKTCLNPPKGIGRKQIETLANKDEKEGASWFLGGEMIEKEAVSEGLTDERTDRETDRHTDDPITRCPRRSFQVGQKNY